MGGTRAKTQEQCVQVTIVALHYLSLEYQTGSSKIRLEKKTAA